MPKERLGLGVGLTIIRAEQRLNQYAELFGFAPLPVPTCTVRQDKGVPTKSFPNIKRKTDSYSVGNLAPTNFDFHCYGAFGQVPLLPESSQPSARDRWQLVVNVILLIEPLLVFSNAPRLES